MQKLAGLNDELNREAMSPVGRLAVLPERLQLTETSGIPRADSLAIRNRAHVARQSIAMKTVLQRSAGIILSLFSLWVGSYWTFTHLDSWQALPAFVTCTLLTIYGIHLFLDSEL